MHDNVLNFFIVGQIILRLILASFYFPVQIPFSHHWLTGFAYLSEKTDSIIQEGIILSVGGS